MRSGVVEPHPSPGLEGRGSQYVPGPATPPRPRPATPAPLHSLLERGLRFAARPGHCKNSPDTTGHTAYGGLSCGPLALDLAGQRHSISPVLVVLTTKLTRGDYKRPGRYHAAGYRPGFSLLSLIPLLLSRLFRHLADVSCPPAMVGRAGLLLYSADQSELCEQSEFCEAQSIFMDLYLTGSSDSVDCAHPARHKTGAVEKRWIAHRPHLAAEDKLEFHAVDLHPRAPDPVSQLGIAYGRRASGLSSLLESTG